MRALHLLSLRGSGGKKLRYYPTEIAPLIIPWWFSVSDREIILAFYQQILEEQPLPRVEVDWYRSLVPADRAFLQHIAEKRRPTEHLVVVKVRHESVDLRDVLTHPDLQPFRYVAITCDHSLPNETFGGISELTAFVSQVAEDLYEELAIEFSLRDDGPELLEPLVRSLLNPIPVLEAYNALIDVQAERVDSEKQADAVYQRILRRLVENMPAEDVVVLAAFALRGRKGFDEVIAEDEQARRREALEKRLVLRDERLVRWAKWLAQPEFADVIAGPLKMMVKPPQIPPGAQTVYQWTAPMVEPAREDNWFTRINTIHRWLNEGQVGRVRDELRVLERELDLPTTTDLMRADYLPLLRQLDQFLQQLRGKCSL